VVLKPNMGGGDTAIAKAKVIRADDRAALERAYKDAVAEIGAENVVVQELIPGGGEHQFSYAALWDRGNPVAEFTARRTRQFPVDFGYTSTFVEIVDEPGVADAARTLLGSIGHYGLVEVEFKRDHRDGALRLLDVNPRPWSWFGLCSAAGMDLGTMLWQLADGQPTGPATARPGTAWMYLARDAVAASSLIARKELNVSGYLRSFRQVRAWATFALNDPKPSLIDLPLTSWRVLTRRILISAPSQPKRMGADKTVLPATAQRLVKNGLIWTGLEAVTLPGVQSIFPSSGGRGMIFTLHHVRPERKGAKLSPNALLSITPEFLEQAIETALESGLTPVHPARPAGFAGRSRRQPPLRRLYAR
jgi:predicted ATP-grasp superfamily ATP-dependent carboligase